MAKIIFPSPIADQGVKTAIPTDQDQEIQNRASYHGGFPSITSVAKVNGGLPPRLEDMNYILFALSNEIYEQQRGIVYTYEPGVVYMTGAILWNPNGDYFVKSLVDNNTTSDLTDTTKWQRMTVNETDFLGKANINLGNIDNTNYAAAKALNTAGIRTIVSTGSTQSTAIVGNGVGEVTITVNYRIWSDGWCQQWGEYPSGNVSPFNNGPYDAYINLPYFYHDIRTPWKRRSATGYPVGSMDFDTWRGRFATINSIGLQRPNYMNLYTYDWETSGYGPAPYWIVEGQALGSTIFEEIIQQHTEGDAVEQLGTDVAVTAGKTYILQGQAASGENGGGSFECRHKFTQGGTLRAYMIRGRKLSNGNFSGNGVMITLDGTPILVAGGGGQEVSPYGAAGGGGYNGGAIIGATTSLPGYSYDGSEGNSTSETGGAGAPDSYPAQGITAYGGSGYVHPDFVADTEIHSPGEATRPADWSDRMPLWGYGRVTIIRGFEWLD